MTFKTFKQWHVESPASVLELGTAMPIVGLALLALSWVASTRAEEALPATFAGLAEEMNADEQARSGIETLSPEQRDYLDRWLRDRFNLVEEKVRAEAEVAVAQAAAEIDRRVAEEVEANLADDAAAREEKPFEAVLLEPFSGWDGDTVFRLDNGQVWRQRSGRGYRHQSDDLRVRFTQNMFGGWVMELLGTGRSVLVKRVK